MRGRLERIVQVSRFAAAMLKALLSLRGCGSSGQFASRGGRFWSLVQAVVRGLAGSKVMTLNLLARLQDSVATQWLERQEAGCVSACGALVMCAFWLRAQSNHRGTPASLFSLSPQ